MDTQRRIRSIGESKLIADKGRDQSEVARILRGEGVGKELSVNVKQE